MIETVYFAGPSIYGLEIDRWRHELWLPPARQGDVLRVQLQYCPHTIVLIDGYLRTEFPTWVKELVYVMLDGTRFIGASSLGAIRAAELARFGAIGIGKIFEAYRDGVTEDESWVMLTFHPVTFQPLTDPPCTNAQKQIDALQAIHYARTNREKPRCTLKKSDLGFGLQLTIDRVLADSYILKV